MKGFLVIRRSAWTTAGIMTALVLSAAVGLSHLPDSQRSGHDGPQTDSDESRAVKWLEDYFASPEMQARVSQIHERVLASLRARVPNPDEGPETDGHLNTLVVPPGTEILFQLNRPFPPYDVYFSEYCTELNKILPPDVSFQPVPARRMVVGEGGSWSGAGLVWATDRHILYVAPDSPNTIVELSLSYEGIHFDLSIATSGEGEMPGVHLSDITPDTWLGKGSGFRLRVVRTRSWQEAGENRPLPPGAFEKCGFSVDDTTYPLYFRPGKPLEKPKHEKPEQAEPVKTKEECRRTG